MTTRARAIHLKHQKQHLLFKRRIKAPCAAAFEIDFQKSDFPALLLLFASVLMPLLWILKILLTSWRSILGWIVWCLGDRLFGPGSQCDAYKTEPSLHIQVFVWHNLMWFVTNFPAVRSSYSSKQCKLLITTCGKNSICDCSNLLQEVGTT